MDRDTWLKYYEQLPAAVQDYLLDPASSANEEAAQSKLGYDNDAWDRVLDAVWELLFLKRSALEFRESLKPLLGDRTLEEVEKEILFRVVLPMADLLSWEIDDRLLALGVPLKEIQSVVRISLRPVSYGAAVRRIASLAKISLLSDEYVRRLREVLVSYMSGVRSSEQMKEVMQRSQSDGGVGFSRDQAEVFVKTMLDFIGTTHVMSEQDYATWLAREQEMAEQVIATSSKESALVADSETHPAGVATSTASAAARDVVERAVQSVMDELHDLTLDEYLKKRLENTISIRLRDVRNDIQTKSILQREAKIGGVELDAATADRVAVLIERAYNTYRGQIIEEEKQKIQQTLEIQKQKVEERKKRESEEHAKWYQEKVRSTQDEAFMQEQFRQAMQGNLPSAQGTPGLRLDSVVAPTRLKGLAEELAEMTWDEFRRLAKTPDQSAEKIRQKLETLKGESFESWTTGVQAWRQSPLQQEYLKLITESFSTGKPVIEVVEARHAQDPHTPSPDEVSALIQLNGTIQF